MNYFIIDYLYQLEVGIIFYFQIGITGIYISKQETCKQNQRVAVVMDAQTKTTKRAAHAHDAGTNKI